jgi:hypothetical protein
MKCFSAGPVEKLRKKRVPSEGRNSTIEGDSDLGDKISSGRTTRHCDGTYNSHMGKSHLA